MSTGWETEAVFHNADDYFRDLLAGVDEARETIDFETYIFASDEFGERVLQKLREAAARGVQVRLLVDGIGSPSFSEARVRELRNDERGRIVTRVYHPFPWAWFGVLEGFARVRRFVAFFYKLNRRDHRKVCVVDRRRAWIGSMNVCTDHLREFKGEEAWRDTGVRVEGQEIFEVERAFERAWHKATGVDRKAPIWHTIRNLTEPQGRRELFSFQRYRQQRKSHRRWIRLNASRTARRHDYRSLVRRIARASERVWITNAYFVPDIMLLRALRIASWAGADVRVLVPKKSDVFFMPWVTEVFYQRLLVAGIRVFEYLPTFIHAKTLIIDDWAAVGSSNLNHRSLLHDLEIDVSLSTPSVRQSLCDQFEADLVVAREVSLADWRRLPWFRRLAARLLLSFRYYF